MQIPVCPLCLHMMSFGMAGSDLQAAAQVMATANEYE